MKHKVHTLKAISWCRECWAPVLMACTYKSGAGICIYTEKRDKKHRCSDVNTLSYDELARLARRIFRPVKVKTIKV